jgi:1-deoxy-D-xylulose-5-phosphate synthase
MYTAQLPRTEKAFSIRYPRGKGVMRHWRTPMEEIRIGRGRKLREGDELLLLTIGHVGNYAVEVCNRMAKKNISVGHYDMRFVKPIDEQLLHEAFSTYKKIITIEDGCIQGGFGSAVLEFMADNNYHAEVKRLGIPDRVVEHGEQKELHHECGFDPEGIERAMIEILESVPRSI